MNKFNNLDGSVDLYDAVTADNSVNKNYFDAENFYPASGRFKGTILDKKERAKRRAERQKRKNMDAEGRLTASKGLAQAGAGDAELIKLTNTPVVKTKTKSSNKTLYIGIGVFLVLAVGGYIAYKKFGKK